MSSDRFTTHDVAACRNQGHKLRTVWSDKNPLKMHLVCDTCSTATGKSVFVAYGNETQSWGQWQAKKRRDEESVA